MVKALKGFVNADGLAYEREFELEEGDPLYWMEMEADPEESGIVLNQWLPAYNAFCPTGPGGGMDNSCPPSNKGSKVNDVYEPNFISSQKGNVDANLKAVAELKTLALKGDLKGLNSHEGTPSPKVQAYKQALIQAVKSDQEEADKEFKKVEEAKPLPNPHELKFVKDLPGSTHPKLMEDGEGNKWVVKAGAGKEDQLRNENDTDAAYRALGLAVPKSGLVETTNGPMKVAGFLKDAQTLKDWETGKSQSQIDAMHKEISKGFVADALLANWDVVGMGKDNIMVADGKPIRVDNGGGLKYRAQGEHKGEAFGAEVKEMKTLKDASLNPSSARVFKSVTAADMLQQTKEVLAKRQEVLDAVKDPISKNVLTARFNYLQAAVDKHNQTTAPLPVAQPVAQPVIPQATSAAAQMALKDAAKVSGIALATLIAQNAPKGMFSDLQLKKISFLNPNGLGHTVYIPKAWTGNGVLDKNKLQVHTDLFQKFLPPGTKFKAKDITNPQMKKLQESGKGPKEIPSVSTSTTAPSKINHPEVYNPHGPVPLHQVEHKKGIPEGVTPEHNLHESPRVDFAYQDKWYSSLTSSQRNACSAWADGQYGEIRQTQMGKGHTSSSEITRAKAFEAAMETAPLYTGGTVWRGTRFAWAHAEIEKIKKVGVGGTWADGASHSMSTNPYKGYDFSEEFKHGKSEGVLMFQVTPKTAKSLDKYGMSTEREVIGHPKAKYRITKIEDNVDIGVPETYGKDQTKKRVKCLVHIEEI